MNKEVYFAHLNSKPMTQYQFSSMLYKALKFQDIQTSNYKTHSFRIREATHLYLGGLSEGEIQHQYPERFCEIFYVLFI